MNMKNYYYNVDIYFIYIVYYKKIIFIIYKKIKNIYL